MSEQVVNKILNLMQTHQSNVEEAEISNIVCKQNYEFEREINGCQVFGMTKHLTKTEFVGKDDKAVLKFNKYFEELKKIFIDLGAYFEILDTIYSDNLKYMKENGDFIFYTHGAVLYYVIIRLKEVYQGEYDYNFINLINFVKANKRQLFDDFEIIKVYEYEKSGDIAEVQYPRFPIKKLLKLLDEYLDASEDKIELLKNARSKICSHIPKEQDFELVKDLSYNKVKEIYSELYQILDCIFVAQNWTVRFKADKTEYSLGLTYINEHAEYGEKKLKEEHEKEMQRYDDEIEELRKKISKDK